VLSVWFALCYLSKIPFPKLSDINPFLFMDKTVTPNERFRWNCLPDMFMMWEMRHLMERIWHMLVICKKKKGLGTKNYTVHDKQKWITSIFAITLCTETWTERYVIFWSWLCVHLQVGRSGIRLCWAHCPDRLHLLYLNLSSFYGPSRVGIPYFYSSHQTLQLSVGSFTQSLQANAEMVP
jgi:hypothetical protein